MRTQTPATLNPETGLPIRLAQTGRLDQIRVP